MPESYYGDDDAAPSNPTKGDQDGEEKSGKKTAVINSEICPGMKVGEEMVVQIEEVRDGEYVVSYAPEPGSKDEEEREEGEEGEEGNPGYGGGSKGGYGGMSSLME